MTGALDRGWWRFLTLYDTWFPAVSLQFCAFAWQPESILGEKTVGGVFWHIWIPGYSSIYCVYLPNITDYPRLSKQSEETGTLDTRKIPHDLEMVCSK